MQNNAALHEKSKDQEALRTGSDRTFGFLMAVIFLIIGLFPLWGGGVALFWSLATAGGLAFVASLFPRLLHQFNTAWCHFGRVLHLIMTPLIMGIVFFIIVTPMAIMFKLIGRDSLLRKFDPSVSTYWIEYNSRAPASESMRDQF
jgi:hypothetical protein